MTSALPRPPRILYLPGADCCRNLGFLAFTLPQVEEHRGDDGDVGQVRAAVIRVIDHVGVPLLLHGASIVTHHGLDRLAHGPEMHWNMRGIGHQIAHRVEQCTGEIKLLLDVDLIRAVFCRRTPICSAIDMKRLLKTSSITGSAVVPRARRCGRSTTRVNTTTKGGDRGLPAWLN